MMDSPAVSKFPADALSPPWRVERLAIAALIAMTFALTLVRVDVTDTPWHLATARWAWEKGHWPAVNTFSWTHPEYPLQQQYPVYQSMLLAAYRLGSWEGLSVFQALAWTAIFCLAIVWGGGFRWAACWPAIWLLGFLGLQRRMTLRPDIATFLALFGLLYSIDLYRRGRIWAAALFVLFQWLFANSHQLFPIGLAVQAALLTELIAHRLAPAANPFRPIALPLAPAAIGFAASIAACLFTPLGMRILQTPFHTAASLSHHRMYLQEFRPIWTESYPLTLALLCGLVALATFFRAGRNGSIYEWLVFGIGMAVAASAVRGAALFCILSIGLASRNLRQWSPPDPRSPGNDPTEESSDKLGHWGMLRMGMSAAIIGFAVFLSANRWFDRDRGPMAFQPGVGKWLGWWPDESIAFLKRHKPPGKMLNLGWFAGNGLIWGLYPKPEVFVDPRFETYPLDFLLRARDAEKDPAKLDQLIGEFQPSWIVGETRLDEVQDQAARLLKSGEWELVHVGAVYFILVRIVDETADYRRELEHAGESQRVADLQEARPEIACHQHWQLAKLFERFARALPGISSFRERAKEHREKAIAAGKGLASFEGLVRTADPTDDNSASNAKR